MSEWSQIKNRQGTKEFISKYPNSKKFLLKVLRSNTGRKLKIGKLLNDVQDEYKFEEVLTSVFDTKANTEMDVAVFCKNLAKAAKDYTSTMLDINKPNEKPPPPNLMNTFDLKKELGEYESEPKRKPAEGLTVDDIPTQLAQLNQTIGQIKNPTIDPRPKTFRQKGDSIEEGEQKKPEEVKEDEKKEKEEGNEEKGSGEIPDTPNDAPTTQGEDMQTMYLNMANQEANLKGVGNNDSRRPVSDITDAIRESDKQSAFDRVSFELFSHVPPGFSNGVNNKLFRENINRKRKIEWGGKMFFPRPYDGPEMGISPIPNQWKNVQTADVYRKGIYARNQMEEFKRRSKARDFTSALPGEPYFTDSAKGLPTRKQTVFSKQIDNTTPFYNTNLPAGKYLASPHIKPYSSQSTPNVKSKSFNTLRRNTAFKTSNGINWME